MTFDLWLRFFQKQRRNDLNFFTRAIFEWPPTSLLKSVEIGETEVVAFPCEIGREVGQRATAKEERDVILLCQIYKIVYIISMFNVTLYLILIIAQAMCMINFYNYNINVFQVYLSYFFIIRKTRCAKNRAHEQERITYTVCSMEKMTDLIFT